MIVKMIVERKILHDSGYHSCLFIIWTKIYENKLLIYAIDNLFNLKLYCFPVVAFHFVLSFLVREIFYRLLLEKKTKERLMNSQINRERQTKGYFSSVNEREREKVCMKFIFINFPFKISKP